MLHHMARSRYRLVPLPRLRRQLIDWLSLAGRQHAMHALLEVDVTEARAAIRARRAATGEPLSFTAFLVACLARAIDEDLTLQGLRSGDQLVVFEDVDVAVAVEHDLEATKIPVPHVVREANRKAAAEITREIRHGQAEAVPYAALMRWLPVWLRLPAPIRRFLWARFLADPFRHKRLTGTTFVSAVGMFGRSTGWGVPSAMNYSVGLTVGSVVRKPRVVVAEGEERVEPRDCLALTVTLDHDVIDGAPAARFIARLCEFIERAEGLGPAKEAAPLATPVPK